VKFLFFVLLSHQLIYPQTQPADSAFAAKRSSTAFVFGNLHGIGIGVEYALHQYLAAGGSVGIKSPVQVLLAPPFLANRINFTAGFKITPFSWLYVDGGIYLGLYRLTEYLWLAAPKTSVGIVYDNVSVEAGFAFNIPTTIYTQSRVSSDETIGAGEERITPAGPAFPFFKFIYRAK
jgi:hypothetical protein